MPTINLQRSVVDKLLKKKLADDKLANRISMIGTDLEEIDKDEIKVEIFPNRPDMLSEHGFTRALNSFIGAKIGFIDYIVKKSEEKVIIEDSVKSVRPYTACAIVKGLKLDDNKLNEIIQMQEKLHVTFGRQRKKAAIGVYPLDKITFPITYKADVPKKIMFQPLDGKLMSADKILFEHPTGKMYAHLLEGFKVYPYFIDSKNNILSMPPIINAELTGRVKVTTKEIFVECSGHDYDVLLKCLHMICATLADMGGEIYSVELEYPDKKRVSPTFDPQFVELDFSYVNKRLGLNLSEKEIVECLAKMGHKFDGKKVIVPAYRTNILHQVDLIEDIAIAYGYEKFGQMPKSQMTVGEEDSLNKFSKKLTNILIGLGMLEVKNLHLMKAEELTNNMNFDIAPIPLKNALGDHNHLRNWIIPSILRVLRDNQHNEYPQNIFEIGRVFNSGGKNETGIKENESLAIAVCHDKADFTEIKQVCQVIASSLGLEFTFVEDKHKSFISGRFAKILFNKKKVGIIGEIHPQVLNNWELDMPTSCAELEIEEIKKLIN